MYKTIFYLIIICNSLFSQEQINSFVNHARSLDIDARPAAADSFMTFARNRGIPLIEGNYATFLYYGDVTSVMLAGDMNDWKTTSDTLIRIEGCDLFFYTGEFENEARLEYLFFVNDSLWQRDVENINFLSYGAEKVSELAMPGFIQPEEITRRTGTPAGLKQLWMMKSEITGQEYKITVYLPPGYDEKEEYPVAYFQDGSAYIAYSGIFNVLNNMIFDKKIASLIAVLITPSARSFEYAFKWRKLYADFMALELVPRIDSLYSTSAKKESRLAAGVSFGGNISALAAHRYPGIFGNIGLQSAAIWPNDVEVLRLFEETPLPGLKVHMIWGSYEWLKYDLEKLKNSFIDNGNEIEWAVYPQSHTFGFWRGYIDDMLIFTFPHGWHPRPDTVDINLPGLFVVLNNYPNPFNSGTVIPFYLPSESDLSFNIFSATGEKVFSTEYHFAPGWQNIVYEPENIASGIYYFLLRTKSGYKSGKILFMK